MIFVDRWFILTITFIQCSYSGGLTFSVSTYGAFPNDHIDDTTAIQIAINMAITNKSNSIVEFGSGTYNLASAISIFNAVNLTVMGQGMQQTLLLGSSSTSIFTANLCQGLNITSLAIDYDPLPFTAGYVVSVNTNYLEVQIQPPHRADIDRQVGSILRYDATLMRPAFGANTYEIYQTPPSNVNTSLVSPGILRIPLTLPSKFVLGDAIIARYVSPDDVIIARNVSLDDAIYIHDVTDFTIQSITIYTAWDMGLIVLRAKFVNIIDYHVMPHNKRWMSTKIDCMNFIECEGYVNIYDSKCEAMGDDGLDVYTMYFLVTQIINSSALVVQSLDWSDPLDVEVGTRLAFSANQQPFTLYRTATVASSSIIGRISQLFTFTRPIKARVGDWVRVDHTVLLTIRNLTVANNRARGVLLQTENVHITRSLFNRTSGPAVLFQPSLFWREGPGARNVSLNENVYINCNEGIAQEKGVITLLPDPAQLVPIISDVRVESSTFLLGVYNQGLIQCTNGGNVSINGNYVATNSSMPFIWLCNSRNISAHNNTVVNNQSIIDHYYTYDNTNPCQTNLSSLINLPPSAFNSSFPPPVMLTSSIVQGNDY